MGRTWAVPPSARTTSASQWDGYCASTVPKLNPYPTCQESPGCLGNGYASTQAGCRGSAPRAARKLVVLPWPGSIRSSKQGGGIMTRVVVVGDLLTDAVARARYALARASDTPAIVTMHGGGSGANIASWLAVEGAEVAFIGRRGADITGRNRDMELMGYGVDARLVMDPDRPTGTCVVLVTHKGERTMLSDPGANAALTPDDLPRDLFTPGAHLHLSGYTLLNEGSRNAGLAALEIARRAQMTISVDCASAAPLERTGAEPFLEWTQGVKLLFANADQARVLTGRDDP